MILDMKKDEFLTRKLQIYFFGYEKEWENCRFETFIKNNHRSKIMLRTTLNLHVQACESNHHYILIMESGFERKKDHARD